MQASAFFPSFHCSALCSTAVISEHAQGTQLTFAVPCQEGPLPGS